MSRFEIFKVVVENTKKIEPGQSASSYKSRPGCRARALMERSEDGRHSWNSSQARDTLEKPLGRLRNRKRTDKKKRL